MRKAGIITLSLIVAILAFFVFFSAQGQSEATEPSDSAPAATLSVSETSVTEKEWPDIIKATGSITAWQEAIIGAEISGQRLVAVLVDVGDVVKKDQILAQFNAETLMAEQKELDANWVAAESNHKRALSLKGTGAMSDQVVDDYINRAAVAKAQLDAKTLQLKYAYVVAPDDGVISSRTATLGAIGTAGTELFRLIRQNRIEWRGELTAAQSAYIKQGQSVSLALPNGKNAKASIRQIAPAFNPETRMVTVFADIEEGSAAQAGMYAQGEIILGQTKALGVPAKSIVIRDGRNYVFTIDEHAAGNKTARVSQQEVELGQIRGEEAQILSGLSKGNKIVLQGAGFLNDGDIVRIAAGKDE